MDEIAKATHERGGGGSRQREQACRKYKMSDPSNQDQPGLNEWPEESNDQRAVVDQPSNLPEQPGGQFILADQLEEPSGQLADQPELPGTPSSGLLDLGRTGQVEAPSLPPEQQPTAKLHSLPVAPPPEFPGVTPSIENAITLPRVSAAVSAPAAPVERPQPVPAPTIPPAPPTLPVRPVPPPRIGINRRFTLTLVAITIAFLLVGVGILIAGYNAARAELQPVQAAQAFCRDLQSHNDSAAYTLLASGYQSQVTMTQFVQASQLQDQVDGKIRACPTATGPGIDLSFGSPRDHQSFLVTIVRNKPLRGHIALVRENGVWKVEGLEQSLAGTNLGPLLVADTFCQALIKGDYATAYSTLSSRQQSLATEQVFALQFSSALGGPVKLNSCTLDYTTYTIRTGAAAISAAFNLTISTSTGGTLSTNLKTVLSFIQENGAWKVDDFSLQPSAS
jgi:hypothetical protein